MAKEKDYLLKVISESGSLRAYACDLTETVNEAYNRIKPKTLSGIMLGRAIVGAALLGGTLKGRERIALHFQGNGPLEKVIAESDTNGNVRGTVKNSAVDFDVEKDILEQIKGSIGTAGVLTVTKDLGLKEPYSGTVHLVSGEIGEDIAFYLTESEQLPSAVAVAAIPNTDGSGVDVAAGYLIQKIPQTGGNEATDEANIESIMNMIESLPPLTKLLQLGNSPENIISKLFAEVPYKVLDRVPQRFTCSCSHTAMRNALKIAGKQEIEELISADEGAVITCEFCKSSYNFTTGELKIILEEIKNKVEK